MKKYKVYGTYTITITKDVWANSEEEAIEKADATFGGITEYCGNGGCDKLIGVENDDESVAADGMEEWGDYVEELEDDPDYHECPECYEELEEVDDGIWYCENCNMWFDEDGNEVDPPEEEEDDY